MITGANNNPKITTQRILPKSEYESYAKQARKTTSPNADLSDEPSATAKTSQTTPELYEQIAALFLQSRKYAREFAKVKSNEVESQMKKIAHWKVCKSFRVLIAYLSHSLSQPFLEWMENFLHFPIIHGLNWPLMFHMRMLHCQNITPEKHLNQLTILVERYLDHVTIRSAMHVNT